MRYLLNKQGLLNQMNTGVNSPIEYHKGGGGGPSGPSAAELKATADAAALKTSRSNWDDISGRAGAVGFNQTGNRDNYTGYGAANTEVGRREGIDSVANAGLLKLLNAERGIEDKRAGVRGDRLVNNYYNHSNTGNSSGLANAIHGKAQDYRIEGDYNTGKRVVGSDGSTPRPVNTPPPAAKHAPRNLSLFGGK